MKPKYVVVSESYWVASEPSTRSFSVSIDMSSLESCKPELVVHSIAKGVSDYVAEKLAPEIVERLQKDLDQRVLAELVEKCVKDLLPKVVAKMDIEGLAKIATISAGKAIGREVV